MPKVPKYRESDLPRPGSVFIAPLDDGRFGVVRVVRTKTDSGYAFAFVVPSCWIGDSMIRPADEEIRRPLILTHHRWAGHREALWVSAPPPASFLAVGGIEITASDEAILNEGYSRWETLPMQILLQWRWDNDRDALLIEDEAKEAKKAEDRKIAEARRAELLRTVTLDGVSDRTWFQNWDEEVDGPHIVASRQIVSGLIEGLRAAPKLTKTVARRLLREAVKAFNRLDAETQFVETTHREDIWDSLEIVMAAARHPDLVEEIDQWREW